MKAAEGPEGRIRLFVLRHEPRRVSEWEIDFTLTALRRFI
jgi:hypothetical protein